MKRLVFTAFLHLPCPDSAFTQHVFELPRLRKGHEKSGSLISDRIEWGWT